MTSIKPKWQANWSYNATTSHLLNDTFVRRTTDLENNIDMNWLLISLSVTTIADAFLHEGNVLACDQLSPLWRNTQKKRNPCIRPKLPIASSLYRSYSLFGNRATKSQYCQHFPAFGKIYETFTNQISLWYHDRLPSYEVKFIIRSKFIVRSKFLAVQFSLFMHSRPSTKYFVRNTGTGSDGRSCHVRHCPRLAARFVSLSTFS